INLVFGLSMPGIDNWGHIGGLIGGAAVAYGLLPRYRAPATLHFGAQPLVEETRPSFEWLWVGGHVLLLFLAIRFISAQYLAG
ncbi:MAG: rhomboid family intramembrane serine protease, partial [Caldilineaceae bacterium]|nr:rhomboid family intramembrane serine protease [Caldilineaceae bacterium]